MYLRMTGAEVKSLGSSGVSHLVVANELDPADIPVVSSRVTVVKVQVRRGRGHLVVVTLDVRTV